MARGEYSQASHRVTNWVGRSGAFDGTAPPHFYGELVKTDEGCDMLEESGHFPEFADFIRQHGLEDFDPEIIDKLKSVLWAVVRFPFFGRCDLSSLVSGRRVTSEHRREVFSSWRKSTSSRASSRLPRTRLSTLFEGEFTKLGRRKQWADFGRACRTACFALGLISSTLEGAEILEELGWESVCSPLGGATGLCVPLRIGTFIDVRLSVLSLACSR